MSVSTLTLWTISYTLTDATGPTDVFTWELFASDADDALARFDDIVSGPLFAALTYANRKAAPAVV